MLIAEQRGQGIGDLRPGEGVSYPVRENRHLLIGRAKTLKRYDFATEIEPCRWIVSEKAEATLRELGERNDMIETMHLAVSDHGLAEQRCLGQYVLHGGKLAEPVVGRVLAKGLAGDEMGERVHLVFGGVDGLVHHMEVTQSLRRATTALAYWSP